MSTVDRIHGSNLPTPEFWETSSTSLTISECEEVYVVRAYWVPAFPDKWAEFHRRSKERYAVHGVHVIAADHLKTAARYPMWIIAAEQESRFFGGMVLYQPSTDGRLALSDELADYVDTELLDRLVRERLSDGVTYGGGLWIDRSLKADPRWAGLPLHLAIGHQVLARLIGARWIVGSAPEHAASLWSSIGYFRDRRFPHFAYPDPRYRTCIGWCDLESLPAGFESVIDERVAFCADQASPEVIVQ